MSLTILLLQVDMTSVRACCRCTTSWVCAPSMTCCGRPSAAASTCASTALSRACQVRDGLGLLRWVLRVCGWGFEGLGLSGVAPNGLLCQWQAWCGTQWPSCSAAMGDVGFYRLLPHCWPSRRLLRLLPYCLPEPQLACCRLMALTLGNFDGTCIAC